MALHHMYQQLADVNPPWQPDQEDVLDRNEIVCEDVDESGRSATTSWIHFGRLQHLVLLT